MPSPSTRRVPYSSLTYSPKTAQYIDEKGRFLSREKVRGIIDDDIEQQAAQMVEHGAPLKKAAAAFKAGEISQDEYTEACKDWRNNMAASVKGIHLGSGAAAKGGFHAMEKRDFGRVGGLVGPQYDYLENFAMEVAENPDIVLSEAGRQDFDTRAASYAQAARRTYMATLERNHVDNGRLYVENVPDENAQHCTGKDGCQRQTELGRMKHDDPNRIPAGQRECEGRCQCDEEWFEEAE